MTKNNRRRFYVLPLLLATTALEIGASQARADFGFGFGAFNYVPSPIDFVNSHALMNAANATRGPVSRNVYADNPNSFLNRARDNGFNTHLDPDSRLSSVSRANRLVSPNVVLTSNNQPRPAPAPTTVPRPVVPIGSFFNASRALVWPHDAPVAGELRVKRDISDQTCLVVSDMVDKHGSAPITTVASTRQKLLEYGQPALQFIRSHTTPRVAETFHLFLLSLYESLAQAANPPAVTSAASPTR